MGVLNRLEDQQMNKNCRNSTNAKINKFLEYIREQWEDIKVNSKALMNLAGGGFEIGSCVVYKFGQEVLMLSGAVEEEI